MLDKRIKFDERYDSEEYGTTTLYFIAPKEILKKYIQKLWQKKQVKTCGFIKLRHVITAVLKMKSQKVLRHYTFQANMETLKIIRTTIKVINKTTLIGNFLLAL